MWKGPSSTRYPSDCNNFNCCRKSIFVLHKYCCVLWALCSLSAPPCFTFIQYRRTCHVVQDDHDLCSTESIHFYQLQPWIQTSNHLVIHPLRFHRLQSSANEPQKRNSSQTYLCQPVMAMPCRFTPADKEAATCSHCKWLSTCLCVLGTQV